MRPRGGPALSALLPGLPQLLAGRWGSGGGALLVWVGLAWVILTRGGRVAAGVTGTWDERVAVAALLAALATSWLWSWRDVTRYGSPRRRSGQWSLAARAFSKNQTAVAGLLVLGAASLMALMAPLITPADPTHIPEALVASRFLPFSSEHWLGTDHQGRDVLARLLYGARISLTIGIVAMAIAVTIGTLVGAVAGFLGGVVDSAIMRFVDMVIAFPRLVLLIAIVAMFERSIPLIIVVLGLTLWPSIARIVRGEVLSLREREFIEAARALGYSKRRIILKHLIPNALAPVIVAATLGVGHTIVLEAGLSFIGLGVPGATSWGTMIGDGQRYLMGAWWLLTVPGLAIVLTVLSFNLVGDGLRDALDPRLYQ